MEHKTNWSENEIVKPNDFNRIEKNIQDMESNINGLELTDSKIDITDTENHFIATKLDGVLNELFQSANNGKIAVATAIGSPATVSDTFPVLAQKIDTQQAEYQTTINTVTGQRDSLQGNINTSLTHLKNMGCITDPLTADKVPTGILEANSRITNITNEKNTWYNNYTSMETDRNNWMNLANSKKSYYENSINLTRYDGNKQYIFDAGFSPAFAYVYFNEDREYMASYLGTKISNYTNKWASGSTGITSASASVSGTKITVDVPDLYYNAKIQILAYN